jgi:hypothetical protein
MRWLGVFIASQPLLVVGWILLAMGAPDSPVHHRTVTVHCPVRATSSKPLGFGAVDHWRRLSFAAPDSLVPHRTVRWPLTLLFWLLRGTVPALTFPQSTVGWAGSRCSAGSPDSPVAHRIVRWIIAERAAGNPRVPGSRLYGPGAPDTVQKPAHWGSFAPIKLCP